MWFYRVYITIWGVSKWRCSFTMLILFVFCFFISCSLKNQPTQPNIILIFTDDQGYGDLGCFGGTHVQTPVIDRLAKEGAMLTSFYVAAPVCSPSRAGLMTGCYPARIDMAYGSNYLVLLAGDSKGLNPDEATIAEVLKTKGYRTGIFGKWHLGDQPGFLPTKQGFDEFFGLPYSHDIHPFNPSKNRHYPPLPLMEGDTVIEIEPDADYLTKRITERAVQFIGNNYDKPFFLYIPHPIPHCPLHVSPPFMESVPDEVKEVLRTEGDSTINYKERNKLYPQAISEIDWSVGQIIDALKKYNIDRNTLVFFTSDNGPAAVGSVGPLRGRKARVFEGGMRMPAVAWYPGKIPAGSVNDEILTTMDLLPTFAKLADAKIPADRVIDGKDIWATLSGQKGTKPPHDRFFYYRGNKIRAVRSGPWKLHVSDDGNDGWVPKGLYNLETDIGEQNNVASDYSEIVGSLIGYIQEFNKEIISDTRSAGYVEDPGYLTK